MHGGFKTVTAPTYAILPLLREPFLTFLQNSQDLWFDQMGDGKRVGAEPPLDWVAPDGCLCDARPAPAGSFTSRATGGQKFNDWGMEFTAAGIVMQSELLLIGRDPEAIAHYLPRLERSAAFIETRRATNNLFLAGPAGNLLAPSYAGWRRPDGTYDKAYLTGLSITYIAALDRLIELEKLAGRSAQAARYSGLRASARSALRLLTTDEDYFIRSLDPDGTRHGVMAHRSTVTSKPRESRRHRRFVSQTMRSRRRFSRRSRRCPACVRTISFCQTPKLRRYV